MNRATSHTAAAGTGPEREAQGEGPEAVPLLKLPTSCDSRDEFIGQFRPFLDATTVLLPSRLPLSVGQALRFAVTLRDGSPMLEGSGEVFEVQDRGGGRPGRHALRVRIREMTAETRVVQATILEMKRAAVRPAKLPTPVPPTRLFAQGVQACVRPPTVHGSPAAAENDPSEDLFSDVTTTSLALYLDTNLAEVDDVPATPAGEPGAVIAPATWADSQSVSALTVAEVPSGPPVAHRSARRVSPDGRFRNLRPFAAIGISAATTIAACWLLWGRSSSPPQPHTRRAQPAIPATAAAPAPTAVPAPKGEVPPPPCTAVITTRPRGAKVMLGDRLLGVTPLDVPVPCQSHEVTVIHPRYRPATAMLSPSVGVPARAVVRLARPAARLVVISTPRRAVVTVNATPVGPTPQDVSVEQFERARVEARLPGHRPWRKTVYVSANRVTVKVVLKPLRSRPSAAGAPRPPRG